MKVGAILRACRERAGLSQEEMAEKMFNSQSCISKLETDRKNLDLQTLIKWTEVTGAKEVVVAFICGLDGISIMQTLLQTFGG